MIIASLRISRCIFVLLPLLLISTSTAADEQDKPKQEISRDSLMAIARVIIDSSECRALITVDESEKPHARAMSPFPPEDGMIVWLGTSTRSRKVKQIQNNPNVIIYYFDSKGLSYVTLAGKARLVNDPEKKAHYWKESWKIFYPNRDEDYILIEVTPERIEVFSFEYDIMDEPPSWTVPSIDFMETSK
jgi:general stress protein 26